MQCHKALWLKKYRPELADETSPNNRPFLIQARMSGFWRNSCFPAAYLFPTKVSYSIKKVLPVLAPDLSYDSLVIQNGGMAPIEWFRMTQLDDPMVRILKEIRNKV